MKQNSEFVPVYGSEEAISNESKISGQLIFSDEGKIYLDTDDGVRMSIADKTQTILFNQTTASDTWVIEHKMGRYPTVYVVDNDGNELVGDVAYTSANVVQIVFSEACTGVVYLN